MSEIWIPNDFTAPKDVRFGLPELGEANMPQSCIEEEFPAVEAAMSEAVFNNGVALVRLPEEAIESVMRVNRVREMLPGVDPSNFSLVWVNVRLEPGAVVGDHIHREGGELAVPLTPIIETRGIVLVDGATGNFLKDEEGRVRSEMRDPVLRGGKVPSYIRQQEVHGYQSGMKGAFTDIVFCLPETHADASDKLLAVPTLTNILGLEAKITEKHRQ